MDRPDRPTQSLDGQLIQDGGDHRNVWLALVLAAIIGLEGFIVLGPLGIGHMPILGGDGPRYHILAANLLDHGAFSFAYSAPYEPDIFRSLGYPGFLAATYALFGRSTLIVRIAQLIVLWLTGWVLYLLVSRLTRRSVAMTASILCVSYQPFVFTTIFHLPESLATLLTVLMVYLIVLTIQCEQRNLAFAGGAGMMAGIGALVRPSMLLLPALVVAFILGAKLVSPSKRWLKIGAMYVLGIIVCVLPWTTRNYVVSKQFIPLATGSGWSFYVSVQQYRREISYRLLHSDWDLIKKDYVDRHQLAKNEVESILAGRTESEVSASVQQELIVDRGYRVDGLLKLAKTSTSTIVADIPERILHLWSTGNLSLWSSGPYHRTVQVLHFAITSLVLLGLWRSRHLELRWHILLWLVPLYLTVIHIVFHMEPRYSFPGRPFLLVYAAIGLSTLLGIKNLGKAGRGNADDLAHTKGK